MSWLSRPAKVNGLIKGIGDIFDITESSPVRRTPPSKRRSTGREDVDRIPTSHHQLASGGSQREVNHRRRPTIGPETSPFGSIPRGRSVSNLSSADSLSPSLPAPLLLSSKLSSSESTLSAPSSAKRENFWLVLQESLQETDLTLEEAPMRPLTAEENDKAAVWLEVEELRFLDDERLRAQSVKRVLQYLERGNIALDDRSHLLHSLRAGSLGVEALELQRVVWQWLYRLPLPRLLQAAFIKGWERRVTHFPETLFKEFVAHMGDANNGAWQAVEDVQEVRVHTRTFDEGVLCVRGSTTVQASPEEIMDLILHQGDSPAQWDEIYQRGMIRDIVSDSVRAIRIALKHTGDAAKRELHMLQSWHKLDDCYVILMRSIPFTRHQNRTKHSSTESERSAPPTTDITEPLSESLASRDSLRRKPRILATVPIAGYILRAVSYADGENRRPSTQVVAVYSFDPKGRIGPDSAHVLNIRMPQSLHNLASVCHKRARILEKLANSNKIAPPLMVKALVTRQTPDTKQLSFKEGDHIVLFKLRNPDFTAKSTDCVGYLNGGKGLLSPLYISVLERRRLSSPDYHSLLKLLSEPNMICAQGVLAAASPGLKEVTAKAIIVLFDEQGQALSLLRNLLSVDFKNATDASLFLRGHEASALLLSAYSRLIALDLLLDVVTPVVNQVVNMDAEGKRFEIDPEKLQPGDDIEVNRKNLIAAVDLFMYHILNGIERCPVQLRAVCQFLQKEAAERFSSVNANSILGGVMFLRFFCPALVSPLQHGVMQDTITKGAQRGLILISKIIQQLSNAQSFGGGKEEHMVAFNAYITENIPIVKTYLTKLTTVPYMYDEEPLSRAGDALPFTPAEMTDLGSVLHYVIVQHLDDLHTEIGHVEVSHGTAGAEIPFKRLLEMLFALPLPTWTSNEDVEMKALELFHNFTAKKRAPGLGDSGIRRRSMPFRISPYVTKNLETLVAPHAVPIATAQAVVNQGRLSAPLSPSHSPSPMRRHSRADHTVNVPSPLHTSFPTPLAPAPGRVPQPQASPPSFASTAAASSSSSSLIFHPSASASSMSASVTPAVTVTPATHASAPTQLARSVQHNKPLPPPPLPSTPLSAISSSNSIPADISPPSPSDSSPEGRKEKDKKKKKEKKDKKHKKEKKLLRWPEAHPPKPPAPAAAGANSVTSSPLP